MESIYNEIAETKAVKVMMETDVIDWFENCSDNIAYNK